MRKFFATQWQRVLRRIGVSGLIGLALLMSAGALAAWTPRLQREAVQIEEAARGKHLSVASAIQARARLPSTRQQLLQFTASFPPSSQNADDLKQVFAAAKRNHVALPKGEYQINTEPNSPFVTYAATFPVKEGYGGIKDFAADVLRRLPHAAMDDLRLERSDAGAAVLDARIRITLIYRAS